MKHDTRTQNCLNGWWDFLPLCQLPSREATPPRDSWQARAMLVPSSWAKSRQAVRLQGESCYRAFTREELAAADTSRCDFLYDAYGYPNAWTLAAAGWVRRKLHVPQLPPQRRRVLVFDAVAPQCAIFINGRCIGHDRDPMLPIMLDVTDALQPGENELAVLIKDFDRDARGRTLAPSGNEFAISLRGIWQNVWLREHDAIHVSDVTIRTSTRTKQLEARVVVTNAGDVPQDITCTADIAPWRKGAAPFALRRERALGTQTAILAPGASAELVFVTRWRDARWWEPAHPHLYWLRAQVHAGGRLRDTYAERFGFREVWLDGIHLMLNDHPVHLFSDWGHKVTPFHHTEQWIRQWFGMMRDANMNHTRLHTHPHLPLTLDIADEMGILVTGETGIHGSGAKQGADDPAYWQAAREHIRRFVRRDKNHPCLIMWSVENEMRWNRDETTLAREELPKLRALFNQLDPTRPAYHEGDSSMWDERAQPIISRHYNKDCSGLGWWQRTQPLHAGEMAVYHYAGPNNTCHLAGDEAWADYRALDRAAATDAALIIESGRTLGVCCFGPWNISCLENLRMDTRTHKLAYNDYTAPGVKPLLVKPHTAEFEFWRRGKGYTPFESFAIQARAFRPLAVIDRSQCAQYFAGAVFARELFVVNDTEHELRGALRVRLVRGTGVVARKAWKVRVARGHVVAKTFSCRLPATLAGTLTYDVQFTAGKNYRDAWQRRLEIAPRVPARAVRLRGALAVFGPGSLRRALDKLGIAHQYVTSLEPEALRNARVLLLEAGTVTRDDAMRAAVHAFAQRGGRVIILEQDCSIFPALPIEDKPLWRVFPRVVNHPLLAGIRPAMLDAWGDEPYAVEGSAACVARKLYRKDGRQNVSCILDGDEGGFGFSGFAFMGLLEAPVGEGLVLACQLRVTETLSSIPAAQRLLLNMLRRADTYAAPAPRDVRIMDGADAAAVAAALADVRNGARMIINNAGPATLAALNAALKLRLRMANTGPVYQLVRAGRDPVLNGVSNEDTCGIERFSYCSVEENMVVATQCLAPARGLEPLLVTPARSFLKELFVDGGKTEFLRSHTISRCVHAGPPPQAVGLGRIRVGDGEVYLNQFAPPLDKRVKFYTLLNRLNANVGARRADSILDAGPRVEPTACSTGSPHVLWVLQQPCDDDLRARMVQAAEFSGERLPPASMLALGAWRETTCEHGRITVSVCGSARPVWLYSRLRSPIPRKNIALDIGIPNPAALTFLEAIGTGTLELFVNGVSRGMQTLSGVPQLFPDIALEQGWNQILLAWMPADAAATLQLTWRTITAQPETSFEFA